MMNKFQGLKYGVIDKDKGCLKYGYGDKGLRFNVW